MDITQRASSAIFAYEERSKKIQGSESYLCQVVSIQTTLCILLIC